MRYLLCNQAHILKKKTKTSVTVFRNIQFLHCGHYLSCISLSNGVKWTWAAPDVSLSSVAKSDSHLAKHQFNAAVPWKQEGIRPLKVASYSIGRTTTTKNPLHTQQMRHQRVKKVDRKQRNNPKVLLWVARSFSPSLGRLCLFVARCPRGPWCTLASPTTSYTQTHKQKHK